MDRIRIEDEQRVQNIWLNKGGRIDIEALDDRISVVIGDYQYHITYPYGSKITIS